MKRQKRGSQSIEFALILPVLLGITSGIIDYGWYFYIQNQFSQVIKDSARSAATLDHEASDYTPCHFFSEITGQNLNSLGFSNEGRVLSVNMINLGELRLAAELNQDYKPLFGLAPTPDKNIAKITIRLEDQNWESCQ